MQALPDITLEPNQTYLVQEAAGGGGTTDLPLPDLVPSNPFNMSATSFKVALTSDKVAVMSATQANVLDLVGVGTANIYEGAGAAPAASNTKSVARSANTDSNNNSADFVVGNPTPMNSAGNTTPVTIKDFLLSKENSAVRLDWSTASEFNSKEFVVERSGDNKNWETIGTVAAARNSSAPLKYFYVDTKPLKGENFYRLKMVDLDGSFEYYLTKNINISENISLKLYPNPVKDILHVETVEKGLNVEIYNVSGSRVQAAALSGNAVDLSKLAAGIYFIKVYNKEGVSIVQKVVKL